MSSVEQLMRSANPVPDPASAFNSEQIDAVFLLSRARSGNMDVKETKRTIEPQQPAKRGWLVAAAAFSVVILVGIVAAIALNSSSDQAPVSPETTLPPTTVAAVDTSVAVGAAEGFLHARMVFDTEAALGYLSSDATVQVGPADSVEMLPLEMAWQEATGLVIQLESCSADQPVGDDPIAVTCLVVFESPVASVLGHGSTTGTYELTVVEDRIVSVELTDIGEYSSTVWGPFEAWIKRERPESHADMYEDPRGTAVLLTEDSIELWRTYTAEFVGEQVHSEAFSAVRGFVAARAGGDVESAVTYLAPDAVLDWGPGTSPDELSSGLAWESALGITFEPRRCVVVDGPNDGSAGVVTVRCAMVTTSAISEAVGDRGDLECVDLSVQDGLIRNATLGSYRGALCPGFSFASRVFDPFTLWLGTAHPEVSFDDLYANRSQALDIETWRQLTDEFVADAQANA